MPKLVEEWSPTKLMPAQNPQDARTDAVPFAPAGAGLTYTVLQGDPIGQVAASKRGRVFVGGDLFLGYAQFTFTVDDTGECWFGDSAVIDSNRGSTDTQEIFVHGTFDPRELTDNGAAIPAAEKKVLQDGFVQF